jgi:hypothetical protein
MAKAQQKKTAAKAKKPAAKVLKKKVVAKKSAKPAPKVAKKPAPKKAAEKVKKVAKAVKKAVAKVVKPAKAVAPKPAAKPAPKPAVKPAVKQAAAKLPAKPVAVKPPAKPAPKAPAPPPPAAPKAPAKADEKKRGRRARPRVQSSGAPVAAWLSTEKPRSASFIPAPPRAEAPSAVAAPPASSDRLIRPDDIAHPAVRTVPVRIDIEQGAGRFYVIASAEVTVRVGEGLEWDFRYVGGADVMCDEVVIEFDRPSPFSQTTFRSRRPGGARPHRQLSGGAIAAAAGKRVQYTARALTGFKTELASTKLWVTITA